MEKLNRVLERENQRLKEDVSGLKELLKLQKRLTGGTRFTEDSVAKVTRKLMQNNDIVGDRKELSSIPNDLYSFIATSEELSWESVSNVEAAKGAISVGNVYNLELLGGASACPGDYLYRSGSLRWDVESGMWGILRVKMRTLFYTVASCCRNVGQWWEKAWKKEQ